MALGMFVIILFGAIIHKATSLEPPLQFNPDEDINYEDIPAEN